MSTPRLAVTGLSRSGKSVFIASLVHNLLSTAKKPTRMPLLRAASEGRFVAASLRGPSAQIVPLFPYAPYIAGMAGNPPVWPHATNDISEMEIEVRFKPKAAFSRLFSGSSVMRLSITDYPGEWLLDLPLLRQSYTEWSRATLELFGRGVRAAEAKDWRNYIAQHGRDETADEDVAKQAHRLYCELLIRCRDRYGLSYLQPGRFIRRGTLEDSPFLWFCPLEMPAGTKSPRAGSLGALMEARFETYKTHVVEAFYNNHFRRFNRQIVLVDVLQALLGGEDTFSDCRMALGAIMESFRFGSNFLPALFGRQIDRVLFAATKADHVTRLQRDHLTELLNNMIAMPELAVKSANATTEVMALASVVCTEDGTEIVDGRTVDVVAGLPVDREKRVKFFPGPIPLRPPKAGEWHDQFLGIPVFRPPSIEEAPVEGIPHINLDAACEFLLGDKLA